uniref:thymidine kinase n=1 Tax=viral metagenome TaxID=1070528 RepID=A0A6C0HZA0_9ZZZZ
MCGILHLYLGPMFSGKTTKLIQIYKTRTYIGKKVVVLNYSRDKRYSDSMLSTHDKMMIPCIFTDTLSDIWKNADNIFYQAIQDADTILINEGQFFPDIYQCVIEMVEDCNKEVHICGLDGDFQRNVFGSLLQLIPYCNTVEKLNALCADCRDGTNALFSYRISQEMQQVVIGSDNYKPLCRDCYNTQK